MLAYICFLLNITTGLVPYSSKSKYNTTGFATAELFTIMNIHPSFINRLTDAMNLAISENTKGQYRTAVNHVTRCANFTGKSMTFPFDLPKTLNYVGFLLEVRKVKSTTVSQCLSALRYVHLVQGQDPSCLRPAIVTMILKGREHWEHVEKTLSNKVERVAVTVKMMKYLKASLAQMDFLEVNKLMIWAVCCLMFCGSLRVHEVLSKYDNPCPQTTLMYDDLQITDHMISGVKKSVIKLKLKSPKENRVGRGLTIEIFGNDSLICPVKALKKWMRNANFQSGQPMFRFLNNKAFKGRDFNKILSKITGPILEGSGGVVRAHSFRAALSTEMGLRGFSQEEIQHQGRWTSDAFKAYIKKDQVKRLHFTEKWIDKIVKDNL